MMRLFHGLFFALSIIVHPLELWCNTIGKKKIRRSAVTPTRLSSLFLDLRQRRSTLAATARP